MPRHDINGIGINVERFGEGPPLLMLHGFTGSTPAWQGIPERLGDSFTVYAIDIIGHGKSSSPDDPYRYRIDRAVDDIAALANQLGLDQFAMLGYSMGGRVALHFALANPERVSALILESASPGIVDHAERERRIAGDEKLASMIEQDGLAAFVDYWESIPLFGSQRNLPEGVRSRQRQLRLAQNPVGLAHSLRGMGAGAMEPIPFDVVGEHVPVLPPMLYLAGEYDEKYREIGQSMTVKMSNVEYREISGAGHTIHLEQPEGYVESVLDFLATNGRNSRVVIPTGVRRPAKDR